MLDSGSAKVYSAPMNAKITAFEAASATLRAANAAARAAGCLDVRGSGAPVAVADREFHAAAIARANAALDVAAKAMWT